MIKPIAYLSFLAVLVVGCEKGPPSANNAVQAGSNQPSTTTKPDNTKDKAAKIAAFNQMQGSMQSVAALKSSTKGPEFDYKFLLPSDDWTKLSHGDGDRKSSVWLYQLKESGLKVLLSCGGTKEAPEFTKSAQGVYDSVLKQNPSLTREWKVGNFTLRRSFIGFIDDRHGEVTITAFSPVCAIEFNIASDKMDRDELIKVAEANVEEFIKKNPNGGFPSR